MLDSWSTRDVHYVALVASYIHPMSVKKKNVITTENVQRLSLITLSPMAKLPEKKSKNQYAIPDVGDKCSFESGKGGEEDEAETFNAETHLQFMRDNVSYFGCDFDDWAVCVISDNCSTNRKIATDSSKPLVGCLNNKLNLQVNKMVADTSQLGKQIEYVHKTISAAISSVKNAAVLRILTELRAIIHNAARWSGKSHMLTRFVRIRDHLVKASHVENAAIPIDTSTQFLTKVTKSQSMLSEINSVKKKLQTRCRTLSSCCGDIAILQQNIEKAATKPNRKLYIASSEMNTFVSTLT